MVGMAGFKKPIHQNSATPITTRSGPLPAPLALDHLSTDLDLTDQRNIDFGHVTNVNDLGWNEFRDVSVDLNSQTSNQISYDFSNQTGPSIDESNDYTSPYSDTQEHGDINSGLPDEQLHFSDFFPDGFFFDDLQLETTTDAAQTPLQSGCFAISTELDLSPSPQAVQIEESEPPSVPAVTKRESNHKYICSVCQPVQTLEKKHKFNRHRKKHDRPFPCTDCHMRCRYKKDLRRHRRTVHRDLNDPIAARYYCAEPNCPQGPQGKKDGFGRLDSLQRHMRNCHVVAKSSKQDLQLQQ